MSYLEDSDSNESSRNASEAMESDNEVNFRPAEPYRLKPEAPEDYQEPDEEEGEDGLTVAILEAKSENQITIGMW